MTSRRHTTVIAGRLAALGALPVAVTVAILAAGTAQAEPVRGAEQSPVQPGVTSDPQTDAPDPGMIQAQQPTDNSDTATDTAPAPDPDPAPPAPAPVDNSPVGQIAALLGAGSAAVGSGVVGAMLGANFGLQYPNLAPTYSAQTVMANPYMLFGVPIS